MIKNLQTIIQKLKVVKTVGPLPTVVKGLTQDSRLVNPDFIFAARSGGQTNGMKYVLNAKQKGAVVIVTDQNIPAQSDIPMIQVQDFNQALAVLAHWVYDNPTRKVQTIGVTGTDGKTSTVNILKSIIEKAGYPCGLISTITYDTGLNSYSASLTTPSIDRICQILNETWQAARSVRQNGSVWATMEVSSHALALGRVRGLRFRAVGLTNLYTDHLDFHGTLEEYAKAKSLLFKMITQDTPAIFNLDSPYLETIMKGCRGRVITYGKPGSKADIIVGPLTQSMAGSKFRLEMFKDSFIVKTSLIGNYQGENIALAAGLAFACGIPRDAIIEGVRALKTVPGRMQQVNTGQSFRILVDYSHTPNALKSALSTIRPLTKNKLIAVFGCGGNRDKTKRPLFGDIGTRYADQVIITSDNPRDEEPDDIINDILKGLDQTKGDSVIVEPDRRRAIELAVSSARSGDVILISGKGDEDYQLIKGVRHSFDDRVVAEEACRKLGARH